MIKSKPYLKLKAKSSRLEVRHYNLTDYSRCKDAASKIKPLVNEFDGIPSVCNSKSYCEFKKKIEIQRNIGKEKTHFIFGIFLKKSGELVGQMDIFTINETLKWGNLGYQILNHHWGKGYATEASRLLLKMVFKEMGFHRIEAGVEPKNRASINVAKKIKMEREGIRKKFFPEDGGVNLVIYGANKIDYR